MATNLESTANGLRKYGDERPAKSYAWDMFVPETATSVRCAGRNNTTECNRCSDNWCNDSFSTNGGY